MNKRKLRTQLALKIAPWLKPGEPVAREWKISGERRWDDPDEHREAYEAWKKHAKRPLGNPALGYGGIRPLLPRREENGYVAPENGTFNAPSEVTWKGSWADRATR